MLNMKARAQFFRKRAKGHKKIQTFEDFFYHFLKGHSHTCNYCMYERSKLCLAVFQLCYWYIFVHYLYARLIFFQIKQRVSVLVFFQNFNNINVIRQYSHFKTIMLNINIFGPYWLYNTTNWFVSILSLTAVSLHY